MNTNSANDKIIIQLEQGREEFRPKNILNKYKLTCFWYKEVESYMQLGLGLPSECSYESNASGDWYTLDKPYDKIEPGHYIIAIDYQIDANPTDKVFKYSDFLTNNPATIDRTKVIVLHKYSNIDEYRDLVYITP